MHAAAKKWSVANQAARLRPSISEESSSCAFKYHLKEYIYGDGELNTDRLSRHLTQAYQTGTIHRYIPKVGSPVEGADLIGRRQETEALTIHVTTGSCHLRAPRRFGKSSLLRELERRLIKEEKGVFFADLSSESTAAGFFTTIAIAAMDRDTSRMALAEVRELAGWPEPGASPESRSVARKELAGRIVGDPASFGETLLSKFAAAQVVMILDELSMFLRAAFQRSKDEAKDILDILMSFRQTDPATHQVVAGSAGLSSYVHFWGAGDCLDDLPAVDLHPLDRTDALILAEELLYGSGIAPTPAVLDRVLAEVGLPVPYFIQALCDSVREEVGGATGITDPAVVTRVYRKRILGPVGNHLFRVWRLGNQAYPESLLKSAERILRTLAVSSDGATEGELNTAYLNAGGDDERFKPLLFCMTEDYDLEELAGRWCIRSKVLRERWAVAGSGLIEE